MRILQSLRICSRSLIRFYSNRNILSLQERGLIQDIFPTAATKEIKDHLNAAPQCVYAGFDPTADSLHVGNLLIIINLIHWQRGGHRSIALIGGATGQVGDPSGRLTERKMMERSIVNVNVARIRDSIQNIFTNHEKYFWSEKENPLKPVKIVNNEDWYRNMSAIEFVSVVGRNFRMGTMLLKQSVQTRINSEVGMSFTEFTYQIFQAFDWLHLYKKYNCSFQIGGSDQMGNLLAGHDLISRVEKKPVYGFTIPIVTTEEGDKFGKTAGNAVWLDSSKTSPFSFYQFFIRAQDSDVEKLLMFFTFLPVHTIKEIITKHFKDPGSRFAQKALAENVTKLVHGEEGLRKAKLTSEILYSKNTESLIKLSEMDMLEVFDNAPAVKLSLEPGMNVYQLAMKANCFLTEADAVRIVKSGGFHLNYQKVTNLDEVLTKSVHILPNNLTLLRVGKKNYTIVKWI